MLKSTYLQQSTIQHQLHQWLNLQKNAKGTEGQKFDTKELHESGISVLLRNRTNCVNERCLVIATVELLLSAQRKGWFKSFLTECVRLNPWEILIIEDVENLHIQYFLSHLNSKILNYFYKTTYVIDSAEVLRLKADPLMPYIFYAGDRASNN